MTSSNVKKTPALVTEDFQGVPVVFREDGYLNMTKIAKHYGKDLSNFSRSPETVEYVVALSQAVKSTECLIIQAKRGGAPGQAGTWCHPKLAVFFARWLDVRFAVWCDLMIDNILKGHIQTSVVVPTQEALSEVLNVRKSDLWISVKGRYGETHRNPGRFVERSQRQ